MASAVRLLRAWVPLAPAAETETSHNVGPGMRSSPPARLQLPAASEDFELAPYPSVRLELPAQRRRRQPSIALRTLNLPRPPTTTLPIRDSDTDDHRSSRYDASIPGSPSSSRSASPAPSLCSTGSYSSDTPCPRLGQRRRGARPTAKQEVETLWRQYWD
ncbi:hypothetical protein B0T16DRAFT_450930 [Cercophora newfieldiana]|uniref:Uncharacterized protein n=1 Tax=Cercophora newfieldiana TaxID=92897 RepID=A0AA39YMC9_9PEZI|nr:hypothetical protein B0T16DRAFT_450930 [Cercophora newfieldiana]